MCSICGGNIGFEKLQRLSDSLKHRGADNSDSFTHRDISLFHNRLAIIDLDSASNQPMCDDGVVEWATSTPSIPPRFRGLVIVYNGEIYNYIELRDSLKNRHTFKTKSDTEVILKAYREWGADALNRFNGDFAFCILDTDKNELFCARDRLGNKPFYYYFDGENFAFSSEILPLAKAINATFDEQKLGEAILFNLNDNDERTIFKEIKNLPPAHFMVFDASSKRLELKRYWSLKFIDNCEPFLQDGFEKALDELEELLFDATSIRLRSDVPCSTLLSGGIDSSLLACFISKIDPHHRFVFSSFPNHPQIDESENVKLLQKRLDLNVTFVEPDFSNLTSELDELLLTQGDLFRSFSVYAQFCVFREIAKISKVALSGQGADELFGGYFYHAASYIFENRHEYKNRLKIYGKQAQKEFAFGLKCAFTDEIKIDSFIEDNRVGESKIAALLSGFAPDFQMLCDKYPRGFSKSLYNDITFANLAQLLRYEDRNAMHFGVENRTPFTDYRIVELANAMPKSYKFKNGYTKFILRSSLERHGLEDIAWQRNKIGFEVPDSDWMAGLGLKSSDLVDLRIYLYKRFSAALCG